MITSPVISFGSNNMVVKEDADIQELNGGLQPYSLLNDLKTGEVDTKPYATFEPDYWLLDGEYKIMDGNNAHVGWVSVFMSAVPVGNFGTPKPELVIDFADVHSTTGLKLTFSNYSGDYADSIRIVFYNAALVTISDVIYSPTGPVFSTNLPVSNFKRILIAIWSTSRVQRYARLIGLDFDSVTRFTKSEVKTAYLVERVDPVAVEVPMNTFDFSLYSDSGDFSIVQPAGVYANLKEKEPIDVHEQVGNETVYMGRFYLDDWESKDEHNADFKSVDAIGLLDEVDYLGNLWGLGILAVDILNDFFSDYGIDHTLDSFWSTFGLSGYTSISSAREGLQKMVFALRQNSTKTKAVVSCVRSSKVNILALKLASVLTAYDYTILDSEVGLESNLTLKPLVTDVEIIGYEFASIPGSIQIFNNTVQEGFNVLITFDEAHTNYLVGGVGGLVTGHVNYVIINAVPTGTVTISALKYSFPRRPITVHDAALPSDVKTNKVTIDDTLILSVDANITAQICLSYYQQRYLLKAKFFAPQFKPGDSVLIGVQNGRQLAGIVEKMESDLAGGFISNVEIVGVII